MFILFYFLFHRFSYYLKPKTNITYTTNNIAEQIICEHFWIKYIIYVWIKALVLIEMYTESRMKSTLSLLGRAFAKRSLFMHGHTIVLEAFSSEAVIRDSTMWPLGPWSVSSLKWPHWHLHLFLPNMIADSVTIKRKIGTIDLILSVWYTRDD